MKQKVLITGASGFVGYHLIEAALQRNLEVYAAVRKTSKIDHLKDLDINIVLLDIMNTDELVAQLELLQCDYIIHAAGITRAKTAREYFSVNADYTQTLAEAAMTADIPLKKFIFISSLAALGPTTYNALHAITERAEPMPLTNYGKSKLLAEEYLSEVKDLPLMVFRPTAVYGPREKDIFIMFKSLRQRIEPYIGRSPQRLSFIYAKDLAAITITGMLMRDKYNTYNVSDGKSYSRYALADITKKILAIRTLKVHVPVKIVHGIVNILEMFYSNSIHAPTLNKEKLAELQAPNWECSIELLKKDLGIAPKYDLEAGIKETLTWYRSHNWL
ncbi:MAG: NAD(P)-dependent oxidoreductase [Flavipsychrobacter sp.]|nr:NAD(P)-dependent oxidoreductase [Flavipsychrobacter sp.]